MNYNSLEYINEFYKFQPTQISRINKIKEWFELMNTISKTTNKFINSNNPSSNVLLVLGNIGIGKSELANSFFKYSNLDIIHISKLFDVYESNKSYTTKDFIPKILKQKNVSNYEDIHKKKLLIIDSLEEFIEIQKSVLREIIDNLEVLNIPILIVGDKNSYEDLEKKTIS